MTQLMLASLISLVCQLKTTNDLLKTQKDECVNLMVNCSVDKKTGEILSKEQILETCVKRIKGIK